jgi:hypothetical protein
MIQIFFLKQMQELFFDNPTGLPDNETGLPDNWQEKLSFQLDKWKA